MKKVKVLSFGLACCMFFGIVQPPVSIFAADDVADEVTAGVYEGVQWDEEDDEGTRTGIYDDCDINTMVL